MLPTTYINKLFSADNEFVRSALFNTSVNLPDRNLADGLAGLIIILLLSTATCLALWAGHKSIAVKVFCSSKHFCVFTDFVKLLACEDISVVNGKFEFSFLD